MMALGPLPAGSVVRLVTLTTRGVLRCAIGQVTELGLPLHDSARPAAGPRYAQATIGSIAIDFGSSTALGLWLAMIAPSDATGLEYLEGPMRICFQDARADLDEFLAWLDQGQAA